MAYNPQNPNGQATMANSAPVVIASDQSDLPVDVKSLEGFYDAGNSSTTPLAGGGTFTGAAIDITNYSAINVAVYSNVASATNGFQMQFSPDGTNWDHSHSFTLSTVPGGLSYAQAAELRYFRVVYINGASAQATFRLTTVLKTTNVSPSRYTVAQAVTATQMADVVKAVIYGESSTGGGGSYIDVKVAPSGAIITATTLDAGTATIGSINNISGTISLPTGAATETTLSTLNGKIPSNLTVSSTRLLVDGSGVTQPISGTVTANAGTGTMNVTIVSGATGGDSTFHLVSAASTNATNIKASAGKVTGWNIYNSNASARKVAFHNTAGTPTAGSSVHSTVVVPGLAGTNVSFPDGIDFSSGIAITTVTDLTDAGTTAVGLNDLIINIYYK